MASPAESEWEYDRRQFVSRLAGKSNQRPPPVADDRSTIWSPLARQFADIGRDLYATRNLGDMLRRVVMMTSRTVAGAELVCVTLRRGGGPLHTPCSTHDSAVLLDELQDSLKEGPFHDVVEPEGTGMASSADLADETAWPWFGPRAAEEGVRSVLSVGVFPADQRHGSLSVYSTEPRGLAAADPDIVLILASYVAAALSGNDSVTEDEIRRTALDGMIPSNDAIARGTDFLMRKRRLSPGEAYDILRRASADLVDARRRRD